MLQKALARTSVLAYPGQTPEAKALTPPHSTSARGHDNLHYHNHDLVALPIWVARAGGTTNWLPQCSKGLPRWLPHDGSVFSKSSPDCTLAHECLSQNVIVMTYVAMLALCVFVWYVSCHCMYVCNVSTSLPNNGAPQDK